MRILFTHSRPELPAQAPRGLVLLGALAVLCTGCGAQLVKVRSSVLRLRVDEYSITPQLVEVRAGRLKIIAVNTGILTHKITVEGLRPNRAGNPNVLGGTDVAQPGQAVVSRKLRLKAGRYKLLDTISNHADLGDYATLIVK